MGLAGSKEAWLFQVPAFRRHYQVITFDNRGVDSTRAGAHTFTIEEMAADVIALLDHLGIESAHILGYSLGGLVAQEVAIRYPSRVRKLILASSVAVGREPERSTAGVQKTLGLDAGGAEKGTRSLDLKKVMPALVSLAFNKWGFRALTRLLAGAYSRRLRLDGLAAQLRAPAGANTLDRLGSIRARTLVMTGTRDRVVDPSASHTLASRIPHARLVLVEGGSHAFSIEMSRRFNREVLDFLGQD
jgi:pimeloyl-ACP methyl ester carboxylesterase